MLSSYGFGNDSTLNLSDKTLIVCGYPHHLKCILFILLTINLTEKMTEVQKELELCKYLEDWCRTHYSEWMEFYYYANRDKRNGIYRLVNGEKLMDLLDDITGNIEAKFDLPDENTHLIPTHFASVSHLIGWLKSFKNHVVGIMPTIERNINKGFGDNNIIIEISEIVNNIEQMVDRCVNVYDDIELPRPYQILREKLFQKDLKGFVESANNILKGVPYLIRKEDFNEGYFHATLEILLFVLGFETIGEYPLSDGRIDMVVKLDSLTYIFEFKYTKDKKSLAKEALQQIKDKGYADPFRLTSKEIICVGVSFSGDTKCINDFAEETIS